HAHLRIRLVRRKHALDQHFYLSAGLPATEKPRLDDARVVEHENVARRDEIGNLAEVEVANRSGDTIEMQQAARRTLRRRRLRDEMLRQVVVEIGQLHKCATNSSTSALNFSGISVGGK